MSSGTATKPAPLFGKDETEDTGKVERAFRAFETDKKFYRIVAYSLGVAILLSVIGLGVLSWCGKSPPDGLVAIASAAAGAFGGVLSVGRRG